MTYSGAKKLRFGREARSKAELIWLSGNDGNSASAVYLLWHHQSNPDNLHSPSLFRTIASGVRFPLEKEPERNGGKKKEKKKRKPQRTMSAKEEL